MSQKLLKLLYEEEVIRKMKLFLQISLEIYYFKIYYFNVRT